MNYGSDLEFQGRIRGLISLAGSADRLAKLSGMSARIIGKYAEGQADPTRKRLIAMANATGVTVEWLATGTEPMRQDELAELLERGAALDVVLFKEVIESTEVILFKNGLSLTPSKKADLIVLLYEELSNHNIKKENMESTISKLAKLAG